ncbi:TPA: hypothetical protein N0F65_011917 [Lagenidium giganteum]|uniref:IQ motif and ubiquitin-like domain-containing protein n=1 Tax=Lagenidium giganteum TaxID=4803 RepID=A0AAV2YUW1_9STRA|nr:TPA: hypothetical protein N0F65_011917 [Lagenidium giganteum]
MDHDEDGEHPEELHADDADGQAPLSSTSHMAMAEFFRATAGTPESPERADPEAGGNNGPVDPPLSNVVEFSLLVLLQPENVRHRVLVSTMTTVRGLQEMIAADLRLDKDSITFPELNPAAGRYLIDMRLGELGFTDEDDGKEQKVSVYVVRNLSASDYVMPDQIQVQVFNEETQSYYMISVDVVKFTGRKAYFGGFRHRKTQQIFHHASTQTVLTRARRYAGSSRSHRETQTQELLTRSQQTHRESGTQMARKDLVLDNGCDRYVTAKPYFDSFQLDSLRHDSVLLIQRLWRGYKARTYVYNIREQKRRVIIVTELEAQENAIEDTNHQRREVFRRMHPKTVSDFEVLYNELDKWRQHETRQLQEDRSMTEEQRQVALQAILAKETKLLQTIDRLKLTATDANRKQRIESMLHFMARPKQWQMSDGGVKEVHTPFTIRAKELMDLYHGLKMHLSSVDERLDVLLHVKWTVQEFACPLTRELIELIDREADMLNRGRKEKSLEGLRKRLSNLFLQFIENPEFNPEATALRLSSHAQ